ncbi:MAG: hypothetical protein NT154_38300 [Verrucomicrobia bacterium]|nr:hypothetical protein [Verrucomicrobiota bacterium]
MHTSSPGDGSSTFHYIDVKPLDRVDETRRITCRVAPSTYEELHVGQKLKAWVLETDAVLDYGPKNAASVARTMLVTCMGFGLVIVTGITFKALGRTKPLQATAQ